MRYHYVDLYDMSFFFFFAAGGPFTLFVRPGGEVPLRGSNITFICQMSQENPFSFPFWTDSNRNQILPQGKLSSISPE